MKPLLLEFQAFGPYKGHEIIDFEKLSTKGLFLICGETGSGKTMLLDAMTFALYGKSSGNVRDDFMQMRSTKAEPKTATFVKFIFELNGRYYHFERRLERKRTALSKEYCLMEKIGDGSWNVLVENPKASDLDKKAVELLGLEYEQFRQVIILPQGQFEKLLTSNSEDKEKILTNIFGENLWQKISDKVYLEATARKEELKHKKDKIAISLSEENCETIEELAELINNSKKDLQAVNEKLALEKFDSKRKANQNALILANRFKDMHDAYEQYNSLLLLKDKRNQDEERYNIALKADKIRQFIDDKDDLEAEYAIREDNYKAVTNELKAAEKAVEAIDKEIKKHNLDKDKNDEKLKLVTRYEAKIIDYKEIDEASELYEDSIKRNSKLEASVSVALDNKNAIAKNVSKLKEKLDKAQDEYRELVDAYTRGITGELAAKLEEGKPCPVCGSISHPKKASVLKDSVSKDKVDAQSEAVDKANKLWQKECDKYEKANSAYEDAKKTKEKSDAEIISLKTKLDGIKSNLIDKIDNLDALNNEINRLKNEIDAYNDKTSMLEKKEKKIQANHTEIKTRILSAQKEKEDAFKKLDKAIKTLEKKVADNGFESEAMAKSKLLSETKLNKLNKDITSYDANLAAAKDNYDKLCKELDGKEEPDKAECEKAIAEIDKKKTDYTKQIAEFETSIKRLSAKYKACEKESKGLTERYLEAEDDLNFAKKLRGDTGTGLQRYVLGIMFSSVINAANNMLSLVHDGRYKLFRSDDKVKGSNKRGLELKVFDKYSDDESGRFVNTLSGGEKFLTSLALSIGLSTIAQKSGIKIQALFIDEGFGSLDENSIVDAMNVLSSIQKANGLVGIISHVELLAERIPTKLIVEKTEGESHIIESIG